MYKSVKFVAFLGLLSALLTACGGGGGSNGGGLPPNPTYLNTALTYYLPLAAGNQWSFNTGSRIVDTGASPLSCSCPINGQSVEALDLYGTTGTYAATFYFSKGVTPENGLNSTVLIGFSRDHGATQNLIYSGAGTVGIGVIDDAPAVGQTWSNAGGTSTIVKVGGVLNIQGGQINNVATDNIVATGLNLSWSFAKGVGFASVSQAGVTATLNTFSVNTITSHSALRPGKSVEVVSTTLAKVIFALRALGR